MSQAKPEPRHYAYAAVYAVVGSMVVVAATTAIVACYWKVIKFVWNLLA